MSQVKQVGLLAAGCQPWNKDVCAASGDRFAYCATLAIYIYQVRRTVSDFSVNVFMSRLQHSPLFVREKKTAMNNQLIS